MEVILLLFRKDEKRQYEHIIEDRGKRVRREREGQPQGERRGGRGGRGGDRGDRPDRAERGGERRERKE